MIWTFLQVDLDMEWWWQITNSGCCLLDRDIKTYLTVDCNLKFDHNCLVFKVGLVSEALLAVHHGPSNENIRAASFVFVWNSGLKSLCSRFKWADKTVVRAEKSSFGLFSWKIKWHALNDQEVPFWSPTDVRWHLLLLDLSPNFFFTNKRSSVQDESAYKVKQESWQIELKRKSSSIFFKIFATAFDFLVNFFAAP